MKKLLITFIFFTVAIYCKAQMAFTDITTASALTASGININSKINQTNKVYEKIQSAKQRLLAQLLVLEEVNSKIFKGLTTASSLLNDASTVKNIFTTLESSKAHLQRIIDFSGEHPQYIVFSRESISIANQRILKIYAEVASILSSNTRTLMDSGIRKTFLNDIYSNLLLLRGSLYGILLSMENAQRIGFWKAINPFKGYVNQNKALMQEIIRKSSLL